MTSFLSYLLLRIFTFLPSFLPQPALHFLGRYLGLLAYYLYPPFRKRAESNLALCPALSFPSKKVRATAKACLQNLMITCLEYPKLARMKDPSKIVTCENPEEGNALLAQGKGVIFFCGHQANWELLFLEGTFRMKGAAIGRPIKNAFLYRWILKMRQKFGGIVLSPKNGVKEGLRFLKKGYFFGIVGDQGMPQSGYNHLFLGRKAWSSPLPAILSYKTGAPLITATTKRLKNGKYLIHYAPALFPKTKAPMEIEVRRLMDQAFSSLEKSILEEPAQWLWIHNRWKQQTLDQIRHPYRQDSIAVFFPCDQKILSKASLLRDIYPYEHLALFIPQELLSFIPPSLSINAEIIPYQTLQEACKDDLRFKLIYNLTGDLSIGKFYKKRSVFRVINLTSLEGLTYLVKTHFSQVKTHA